jgi:hypothetical protein
MRGATQTTDLPLSPQFLGKKWKSVLKKGNKYPKY